MYKYTHKVKLGIRIFRTRIPKNTYIVRQAQNSWQDQCLSTCDLPACMPSYVGLEGYITETAVKRIKLNKRQLKRITSFF